MGAHLCDLVKGFSKEPKKLEEVNKTHIMLTPKVPDAFSLPHYRLICLCNVSYKAFTKVLSNRLGMIMEDLVYLAQCSFVPYRQSKENTLIPQEVIHSMKKKRGKSGWMTIKIDLEKAYDRLKWEFI